ncbi:serine hydrolase domain-containing protein [Actinoplanes sp. NEAU-A12]|uniref:Serine hydrolase domain-containing protein n=1 Tax=Actinoplanes sandaracinus TaxID=3045177 RepID=A0ABT6X0D4_9ACTN|nr:serine hydrolase domain-containing protein [Actinoplanes sandaracinus]MDI6105463.1 serine hydrolase domain-containing protein [Actinoplanes sandaracinus]
MDVIDEAVRTLRDAAYAHVGHLVLVRDGEVLAQRQFGRRTLTEPAEVFSVTKSVVATVVLSAVQDGRLSLDASLGDLLGGRVPPGRRAVTVEHLLSMTGGAYCGGLQDIDRVIELPTSWIDALLSVPQRHQPGTTWCYDNGAVHLLAAALQTVTGDVAEFAADRVFGPLGITGEDWPRDPDGVVWGFGGLRLSALDLARLGEGWRTDALGLAGLLTEATAPRSAGGPPVDLPYGWLFWVDEVAGRHAYLAAGWSGQYVLVVPATGVTAVVTGDPRYLTDRSTSALAVARHLAAVVADR